MYIGTYLRFGVKIKIKMKKKLFKGADADAYSRRLIPRRREDNY